MKIFILGVYFLGLSCCVLQEDSHSGYTKNQEETTIEFTSLRDMDIPMLKITDSLGEEVNPHGYPDTLGGSKIILNDSVIYAVEWGYSAYAGPIVRTKVLYAECNESIILLVSSSRSSLWLHSALIVNRDEAGYKLSEKKEISIAGIKDAKCSEKKLEITYNYGGSSAGPSPDEKIEISL